MGEKRPKEAHDRAEVESLHLSLRWSGSWLIPCAGCLGEAQARSPLESQAFACSADQEQRAHCWLEGNSLAAFRMGSRWTIPFGEARPPYSQPLTALSCCHHSHWACRNSGVTAFLPHPYPAKWKTPWAWVPSACKQHRAPQLMQCSCSPPGAS